MDCWLLMISTHSDDIPVRMFGYRKDAVDWALGQSQYDVVDHAADGLDLAVRDWSDPVAWALCHFQDGGLVGWECILFPWNDTGEDAPDTDTPLLGIPNVP